jgi:hypothetical protein
MSDPVPAEEQVFTADYVKKLRDENAQWRKQVRELEAAHQTSQIGLELVRRGVQADPSWVRVPEGMSPADAVASFVEQWPHLAVNGNGDATHAEPSGGAQEEPRTPVPAALPSNPARANTPGPPPRGQIHQRSLEEIKKDPKARQQYVELYQQLLGHDRANQG